MTIKQCCWKIVNGVCSNPNCPTKQIYDNGYRAKSKAEQYPLEDDGDQFRRWIAFSIFSKRAQYVVVIERSFDIGI